MSGFDLLGSLSDSAPADRSTRTDASGAAGSAVEGPLPCSRRGCRAAADWALRWNNPRIHDPQRRKTWLACEEHRVHLSSFLGDRGFLKETLTVAELAEIDKEGT